MILTDLTLLILGLNSAIDHGKIADFDEAKQHIEDGDVFDWLNARGVYTDEDHGSRAEIVVELQSILGAYAGDESRRWRVENNGLSLLLAWVNEIIQQNFIAITSPYEVVLE